MEIEIRKEKNAVVVSVKGRLDGVTSPEFEIKILELIEKGENDIIIDFEKLDYISSAGLRIILVSSKILIEKEGKFRVCSLKDTVEKVFNISGFSTIIQIYESVESALSDNP